MKITTIFSLCVSLCAASVYAEVDTMFTALHAMALQGQIPTVDAIATEELVADLAQIDELFSFLLVVAEGGDKEARRGVREIFNAYYKTPEAIGAWDSIDAMLFCQKAYKKAARATVRYGEQTAVGQAIVTIHMICARCFYASAFPEPCPTKKATHWLCENGGTIAGGLALGFVLTKGVRFLDACMAGAPTVPEIPEDDSSADDEQEESDEGSDEEESGEESKTADGFVSG
jgi:hypothetical protein